MLLNASELAGVAAGEISLVFRRWQRANVKAGTHQRTRIGVVVVDSVGVVEEPELTDTDARSAGHPDLAALLKALNRKGDGDIHRIQLHLAGPDPRVALRKRADLTEDDVTEIRIRLSRMDERSSFGPWTQETLRMIAEQPGVRAPDLALRVGRETKPFKVDVRKLKELGLTESLAIGYRLSPRGRAFLDHTGAPAPGASQSNPTVHQQRTHRASQPDTPCMTAGHAGLWGGEQRRGACGGEGCRGFG